MAAYDYTPLICLNTRKKTFHAHGCNAYCACTCTIDDTASNVPRVDEVDDGIIQPGLHNEENKYLSPDDIKNIMNLKDERR